MISETLLKLIKYIVWYATEHDIKLTTLRLVKFVYLADLYNAMYATGKVVSGCKWYFINYGPYCNEVMQGIDLTVERDMISATSHASKYMGAEEYKIYSCSDETAERLRNELPEWIFSKLHWAIRKYGDDTAALLDYVYFDTEPMIDVKRGDLLDFSNVKPAATTRVAQLKKLSQEKIDMAREKIKVLAKKHQDGLANLRRDDRKMAEFKDDIYYNFVEHLDGEALPTGLKGVAKIVD